jgi:hypothetical protein
VPPGSLPSAFHRVLQRPPLRRLDRWCPLPRTEARFGWKVPPFQHVPSSWFLTTLTASSTNGGVSLLHPTADHEVHRVSAPRNRSRDSSKAFPPMLHPPERSPLRQPSPRHRIPVPPCRSPSRVGWLDSEALLRRRVRCGPSSLPMARRPMLSWASASLERRAHRPAARGQHGP